MEYSYLKKKVTTGLISLTFRKILLDTIGFVTIFVVLAKVLPISVIGIYGIASSIRAFFSYFSDFGLAGALIQKKQIEHSDLKTTFLIQEVVALIISIIIWFSAPVLGQFYQFDDASVWLIKALGVVFFITSLKVIPTILLERELKFNPIVWVDVAEALTFNSLLIYLTFQNLGIWSFTYAALLSSLVGVILIYYFSPWKVRFGFSKISAKSLFNFGLPFQLNSVLALLKDRLTPLITAQIIGSNGFGYVTWAQGIAYRPLEIMSIIIRVTFPAFSRLQDQKAELKEVVERSVFLTTLLIYPMVLGMIAILPDFISVMGKAKFEPALPLFYFFAFSVLLSSVSTIFTNLLNAIGKVGLTLKLMIMWTILTWILSPILAITQGFLGVALAAAIISLTSLIPIKIVIDLLKIDLVKTIWKPLICSILMAGFVTVFSQLLTEDIYSLIILLTVGVFSYGLLMFIFAKEQIILELKEFI